MRIRIAATIAAIAGALIIGVTPASAGTPYTPQPATTIAAATTPSDPAAPKPAISPAATIASQPATSATPASDSLLPIPGTSLPAPVIDTITTYAAPGNANCAGTGACAVITWQPVDGATGYYSRLSIVNPDGSLTLVATYRATTTSASFTGLTADAHYGFIVSALGGPGAWTLEYPVWPETCALPQPYGPENVAAARTAIWDGQSWADWVNANTPQEFSASLQWTFDCESDSASDLLAVEYINADNFTAPTGAGTPIWHLAAP